MGSRLVPDLALSLAVVTLVYCLGPFDAASRLFRDSDTGWHIRTGERILAAQRLPEADPFSFSKPGGRWFVWEWGADVLMGALHARWGLAGVAWLYCLLIAASAWLWCRLSWAMGGDFLLAALLASPMLSTTNLHWLARPHVFGWILLLSVVWWCERVRSTQWRHVLLLASAGALWANLHGSFFLGPAVATLYAICTRLRPRVWFEPVESSKERALWIGAAALAAGSLVNPYGGQLHAHVLAYLGNTELLARVGEFQSFNFHVDGATQVLLAVLIASAGATLALTQRQPARAALAFLFLAMALRSARALPLLALVALPVANGALAAGLRQSRGWAGPIQRAIPAALAYSQALRRIDARNSGVVWVPLIAALAFLWFRLPSVADRTGFPAAEFPVAAYHAVASLPPDSRLLAPDKFGGYLIYRSAGQRPVFFDGRSDYYGVGFMKDYIELVEVRPGWRRHLDRFGFTHAVLPVRYSLVEALEQSGWRRVYQDGVAVLLAR